MGKKKDVTEMTRKEILSVPQRKWDEDIGYFNTLIIVPTRRMHDSGYRCMDFVACKDGQPIRRLSGCSDVVHLGGIGGYNRNYLKDGFTGIPQTIVPIGWNIGCLKKSGLLQIFTHGHLYAGTALSSFELYHEPNVKEQTK